MENQVTNILIAQWETNEATNERVEHIIQFWYARPLELEQENWLLCDSINIENGMIITPHLYKYFSVYFFDIK